MLLVGFGKLAQMIVTLNEEEKEFYIYNRTMSKVKEASKKDNRMIYRGPEHFGNYQSVLLALPPDASLAFLKQYRSFFPEGCLFFYTATNLKIDDIKQAAPEHQMVPAKFAGHALQAIREKSGGTFVVPKEYQREKERFATWIGESFSVVNGTEEMVKRANQLAVEETIKLAAKLTDHLQEEGITKSIQDAVLSQIPAGVLHAHLRGEHGAFAKKVLGQWNQSKGVQDHEN